MVERSTQQGLPKRDAVLGWFVDPFFGDVCGVSVMYADVCVHICGKTIVQSIIHTYIYICIFYIPFA